MYGLGRASVPYLFFSRLLLLLYPPGASSFLPSSHPPPTHLPVTVTLAVGDAAPVVGPLPSPGVACRAPPRSKFLLLFKGGAADSGDQGTSLACLREAEFRGLAYRELQDLDAVAALRFEDALKTDLSLSGGRRKADKNEGRGRGCSSSSLVYVHGLPDDGKVMQAIVQSAVLVHAAYAVWACAPAFSECADVATRMLLEDARLSSLRANASWAAESYVFSAKSGRRKDVALLPQKLYEMRHFLRQVPGPVDLKAPDVRLVLLEDGDAEAGARPHQVWLTREIARGSRGLTERLSLRRRPYVTTTSMEPKASLVMSHVAGLREGDKVCDPMAGGGGLLLAAAQLGAQVTVGVDVNASIDIGRVTDNFRVLGLRPPEDFLFGRADDPKVHARLRRWGPFDVLVVDPPYGKREKGPVRAEGVIQEAVYTLYELASKDEILRVGGRLVFFLPMDPRWASRDIVPLLPTHPSLVIVSISRQPLNTRLDRYLIALQKTQASREGDRVIAPREEMERGAADDLSYIDAKVPSCTWHYK